jgi:hypothetical protein
MVRTLLGLYASLGGKSYGRGSADKTGILQQGPRQARQGVEGKLRDDVGCIGRWDPDDVNVEELGSWTDA